MLSATEKMEEIAAYVELMSFSNQQDWLEWDSWFDFVDQGMYPPVQSESLDDIPEDDILRPDVLSDSDSDLQ